MLSRMMMVGGASRATGGAVVGYVALTHPRYASSTLRFAGPCDSALVSRYVAGGVCFGVSFAL